jgi:cellulose synthase/poly-beta-1,6-N-acetylglucosamine synthase-like glycosyltransferase
MSAAGHACIVTRRPVNVGYKAGNLANGMKALESVAWEYVAVFDADFEMPPDFLYQVGGFGVRVGVGVGVGRGGGGAGGGGGRRRGGGGDP